MTHYQILVKIMINTAMKVERQKHLGAGPYERTPKRQGYAIRKTHFTKKHLHYRPDGEYIIAVGDGVTILDARSFQIVKEIVRVANDVRGMRIDGVKGLDPALEDALRRAGAVGSVKRET